MKKIYALFTLAVLSALICAGCVGTNAPPIYLNSTFNKAQAEQQMRPGRNKIILNAFVVKPEGEMVTCAGGTAELIPATEMAAEFMRVNFGSEAGGQANVWDVYRTTDRIANGIHDFANLRAKKTCNSEGLAIFENIADGNFYVVAGAHWSPWENAVEGYVFAQKVSVRGGETKRVVLSGRAERRDKGFDEEHWYKYERRREWEARKRKQ